MREAVIREQGKGQKLVELPVHRLQKCPVLASSDSDASQEPQFCFVLDKNPWETSNDKKNVVIRLIEPKKSKR